MISGRPLDPLHLVVEPEDDLDDQQSEAAIAHIATPYAVNLLLVKLVKRKVYPALIDRLIIIICPSEIGKRGNCP